MAALEIEISRPDYAKIFRGNTKIFSGETSDYDGNYVISLKIVQG